MKINSKSELISAIYEIWNSFPQDAIDRLVFSFKARLYSIIDRNGESISYLLRSGIDHLISTVIPFRTDTFNLSEIIETYDPMTNENIIEILSKRPFTVEEISSYFRFIPCAKNAACSLFSTRYGTFTKFTNIFKRSDSKLGYRRIMLFKTQ